MSADPDPWLGADKWYHCLACGTITCCTYCVVGLWKVLRGRRRTRLALGCTAGTVAGVAKEIGDSVQAWPFCPCGSSARDLVADMLGVVIGLLLILTVQLCCGRRDGSSVNGVDRNTKAQPADEITGLSAGA
eukprot:COSAG02_NODE_614_length_19515_cov_6.651937_13_plen_132_part_00